MLDIDDHLARDDLRIREHGRVIVDRPAWNVVRLEQREPMRTRLRDEDRRDPLRQRRAVRAWGLEIVCCRPDEHSNSLTAVLMPDGHDADALRRAVLDRFDMSLGTGLGRLKGKVFRIGHLGDFNDLMLAGTLSGVEMGLSASGIPFTPGGVTAALDYLAAKR